MIGKHLKPARNPTRKPARMNKTAGYMPPPAALKLSLCFSHGGSLTVARGLTNLCFWKLRSEIWTGLVGEVVEKTGIVQGSFLLRCSLRPRDAIRWAKTFHLYALRSFPTNLFVLKRNNNNKSTLISPRYLPHVTHLPTVLVLNCGWGLFKILTIQATAPNSSSQLKVTSNSQNIFRKTSESRNLSILTQTNNVLR